MTDVLQQVRALFAGGRPREGAALLERSAVDGDGEALYALANWRLYGLNGPRDLDQTHRLLAAAAAIGHRNSIVLRATLFANGTGVPRDGAAARQLLGKLVDDVAIVEQLALADAVELPSPEVQQLSDDPQVLLLKRLLSADECAYLISRAAPRLAPSSIIDPATRRRVPHPHRDSLGVNIGPAHEDLVVRRINQRIAWASGTIVDAGEPLHILAYDPGRQYRLHHDAIPGTVNQRTQTMLVWLNDAYVGGQTAFPSLDILVRGEPGDALLFANVLANSQPDPRTQHAGLPVTGGRKWLATRWIRAGAVSPFDTA